MSRQVPLRILIHTFGGSVMIMSAFLVHDSTEFLLSVNVFIKHPVFPVLRVTLQLLKQYDQICTIP